MRIKYISRILAIAVVSLFALPTFAQTTTATWTDYWIIQLGTQLWGPLGAILGFMLTLTIAMMIFRKIRGQGRRPG